MKTTKRILGILLALCLSFSLTTTAFASSFTDAHGNVIELDDTLEAYSTVALSGADNAARKQETNLGDLWTDALRWFAVSGKINDYFEEDDVTAGNNKIAVDADHIVALWNGGNLRADIAVGKFGAAELAAVLPYPNKAAVVYMTGAQLLEALEIRMILRKDFKKDAFKATPANVWELNDKIRKRGSILQIAGEE